MNKTNPWVAKARQTAKTVVVRPGETDETLLGATLRLDARDERRYVQAARAQAQHRTLRHELWQITLLAHLLRPGDTFLDIGANVGLFSANLARLRRLDPDLRVVAFEPNAPVRARLQACDVADLIEVRDHALGDVDEDAARLHLAVGSGQSSLVPEAQGAALGSTTVPVRRLGPVLREMAERGGGMVAKIDVEGHELAVLRGGGDELTPATGLHSILLDDLDRDDEDAITTLLRDRGYSLYDARTLEPYRAGDYALLARA